MSNFNPEVPYNDLPPLPPSDVVETVRVLKAVIDAQSAISALNMACSLIPNPAIITSTIPLREAQASTEIENIVTTNDELFRAAWRADATPTPATKEALRYNDALHFAVSGLGTLPVSEKLAKEVCGVLQDGRNEVRSTPGTYIGDPSTQQRAYTPPEGREVIERHLSAWERFIYSDHGLNPLVLMALTHYQFEAIHPFYDGNGRTGRILNVALLVQEEMLALPVLYLSGQIVAHKSEYYRLLRAVTVEGAWEEWILFMVRAVERAAQEAIRLIEAVTKVQEQLADRIRDLGIQPAKELAEVLVKNPYVRIGDVTEAGIAQRQTASKWLALLAENGVLSEQTIGREKIFKNLAVLEVLTQ